MSLTRSLVDTRPLRTSPVFRRLLIGRTVSVLGGFMTMVTVMYQVWDLTRSTAWTGAVGLAQALPLVVFGLFAGAWVYGARDGSLCRGPRAREGPRTGRTLSPPRTADSSPPSARPRRSRPFCRYRALP